MRPSIIDTIYNNHKFICIKFTTTTKNKQTSNDIYTIHISLLLYLLICLVSFINKTNQIHCLVSNIKK